MSKTQYFGRKTSNFLCDRIRTASGILTLKGVIPMRMTGWAITMGVGAAVGAVAVMMLPKQSAARKLVNKAAYAAQDAAATVGNKINDKLDM